MSLTPLKQEGGGELQNVSLFRYPHGTLDYAAQFPNLAKPENFRHRQERYHRERFDLKNGFELQTDGGSALTP